MAARRFFLQWGCFACVLAASPLLAQDRPSGGNERVEVPRETDTPMPSVPDQKPSPPAPTREFKPSEEVSPDQEVDFPADL